MHAGLMDLMPDRYGLPDLHRLLAHTSSIHENSRIHTLLRLSEQLCPSIQRDRGCDGSVYPFSRWFPPRDITMCRGQELAIKTLYEGIEEGSERYI